METILEKFYLLFRILGHRFTIKCYRGNEHFDKKHDRLQKNSIEIMKY